MSKIELHYIGRYLDEEHLFKSIDEAIRAAVAEEREAWLKIPASPFTNHIQGADGEVIASFKTREMAELFRNTARAVAEEREAAAKVVESVAWSIGSGEAESIAAKIRERGQP